MELKDVADTIESVDNEIALFDEVFVEEVDQDFETTTTVILYQRRKPQTMLVTTYAMNIWSVSTDVWHSRLMKCDDSNRHSDENFFEVNPEWPVSVSNRSRKCNNP